MFLFPERAQKVLNLICFDFHSRISLTTNFIRINKVLVDSFEKLKEIRMQKFSTNPYIGFLKDRKGEKAINFDLDKFKFFSKSEGSSFLKKIVHGNFSFVGTFG